jgi:hypothetical protein
MSALLEDLDLRINDILKPKRDVVLACLTVPTTSLHHPTFCCSDDTNGNAGPTCDDCSLDTTFSCKADN